MECGNSDYAYEFSTLYKQNYERKMCARAFSCRLAIFDGNKSRKRARKRGLPRLKLVQIEWPMKLVGNLNKICIKCKQTKSVDKINIFSSVFDQRTRKLT